MMTDRAPERGRGLGADTDGQGRRGAASPAPDGGADSALSTADAPDRTSDASASLDAGDVCRPHLRRGLGVLAMVATGTCTVIGGGINVLTVEIQGAAPGIGALVPLAFVIGAVPAVFVALAYACLSSAMPRAGGSYVYISRGLSPFLGFMATFSKWWGSAMACGVVAYMDVSLLHAAALYAHLNAAAAWLQTPAATLGLPLLTLWAFWLVNYLGVDFYGWTVIALMAMMLAGGLVMIYVGATSDHATFARAMMAHRHVDVAAVIAGYHAPAGTGGVGTIIKAVVALFFAYIGFETVAQAGGEARNPRRTLPLALMITVVVIAGYYVALSVSLYHAAPWQYVAQKVAQEKAEVSMPEVLGALMPAGLAVFVALMAAVALANDLPPLLLGDSRLFYAWAADGVFPRRWAAVNAKYCTPGVALTATTAFASLGAVGCHLFGAVKMGVDSVVLAIAFSYAIAAVTLITLPWRNRALHERVSFLRSRALQVAVGAVAAVAMTVLLVLEIHGELHSFAGAVGRALHPAAGGPAGVPSHLQAVAMNMPACPVFPWLTMLVLGAIIFAASWARAAREGRDMDATFRQLPADEEDEMG